MSAVVTYVQVDAGATTNVVGTPEVVVTQVRLGMPGPAGPTGVVAITDHVESLTPHPAYDDMPSLVLIFENGLI